MYFTLFLLVSLAIAMAAAAPMADRDDSGDIKTARFLEDLTDRGQVQTKRRALGIYGPLYFDRHQPVQEMAEEEDYIDGVIRNLNKAHQQDDIAETEGFIKLIGKLFKKGKKIYKKGKKIYKKGRKIYRKGKKMYRKGRKIYDTMCFRNPRIAEIESLRDIQKIYNRALPKKLAEKQDLLNKIQEIIDLYNRNGDQDAQEQVTTSSEDSDDTAEEEVISIPSIYYASKFHNSK